MTSTPGTSAKIPYPYIRGSELKLISNNKSEVLHGDDSVHQVITTMRFRMLRDLPNPTDALIVLDRLAAQFGLMKVDPHTATTVSRKCGFNAALLLS